MRTIIIMICLLLSASNSTMAVPASGSESGKLLSDWIRVHLKLVRTTKGVAHVAYTRHFAYVSLAVYESLIPGDKNHHSLASQLNGLEILPVFKSEKGFVMGASANAAYAAVLRHFYPNNSNAHLIDSLENLNRELLAKQGFILEQISASSDFGKSVAASILEWATRDGADKANTPYVVAGGEESWKPTPPNYTSAAMPYWEKNRKIVIGSSEKVYDTPPPAYSTQPDSEFYKMVREVYVVSQQLTEEQKNIAWFWDDSPNGKFLTVSGHWSSILGQVIDANKLLLIPAAETYAKMHLAIHDASIVAWFGKYKYNIPRPISYIRKNIMNNWNPLIETPPHPEFPAAHATLSSAAATALTSELGKISFTDATYADLGMKARHFSSFEDAAREAGMSRLYGGIHYRFSIEEGLTIGRRTAEAALKSLKFQL